MQQEIANGRTNQVMGMPPLATPKDFAALVIVASCLIFAVIATAGALSGLAQALKPRRRSPLGLAGPRRPAPVQREEGR